MISDTLVYDEMDNSMILAALLGPRSAARTPSDVDQALAQWI